jgi:hypothetical protein
MQQLRRCLLWAYLIFSVVGFLLALLRLLRGCLNRPPAATGPVDSHVVPVWAFRAPDPLIYSQAWLLARGLAVTWQNPDIHLELPTAPGVPVDSTSLAPDTVYRVFARVWNGSSDAPVAKMPVDFSYLDFGIGGASIPIGGDEVDLPVKGAAGTPTIATADWHTPKTPGHYCLRVRLIWPHDADPGNNVGQHNTDVKALNSPKATFTVPVRNHERRPLRIRLEADGYELPALARALPSATIPSATSGASGRGTVAARIPFPKAGRWTSAPAPRGCSSIPAGRSTSRSRSPRRTASPAGERST